MFLFECVGFVEQLDELDATLPCLSPTLEHQELDGLVVRLHPLDTENLFRAGVLEQVAEQIRFVADDRVILAVKLVDHEMPSEPEGHD